MNIQSIILALILLALFIWAVYKTAHSSSCSNDCSSCHAACSHKNKNEPSWVERYKKDHPKKQ